MKLLCAHHSGSCLLVHPFDRESRIVWEFVGKILAEMSELNCLLPAGLKESKLIFCSRVSRFALKLKFEQMAVFYSKASNC